MVSNWNGCWGWPHRTFFADLPGTASAPFRRPRLLKIQNRKWHFPNLFGKVNSGAVETTSLYEFSIHFKNGGSNMAQNLNFTRSRWIFGSRGFSTFWKQIRIFFVEIRKEMVRPTDTGERKSKLVGIAWNSVFGNQIIRIWSKNYSERSCLQVIAKKVISIMFPGNFPEEKFPQSKKITKNFSFWGNFFWEISGGKSLVISWLEPLS